MTNVHHIGQRLIWLLCLALGVGVSSTAVAQDKVSPEVEASQPDLEREIEKELSKTQELQPGNRSVLAAIAVPFLTKTAIDLGKKLIKKKSPTLKPTTADDEFVTKIASDVVTKLIKKPPSPADLHPKLQDTNILSVVLSGLLQKSKATQADNFVTEALAEVPKILSIDSLSKADLGEIADKAKGLFQAGAKPTEPVLPTDSILVDDAIKTQIVDKLKEIDDELTKGPRAGDRGGSDQQPEGHDLLTEEQVFQRIPQRFDQREDHEIRWPFRRRPEDDQ